LTAAGEVYAVVTGRRVALVASYAANDTLAVYVTRDSSGVTWAMGDAELLTLRVDVPPNVGVAVALGAAAARVVDVELETQQVWCRTVVCPSQRCFGAGACLFGECFRPPLPAGSECDDGNATTVGDVCDGAGGCAGVDRCANVSCPPSDSCHLPGVCSHGACFGGNARPDGTQCDDGNAATVGDACVGGVCRGVAPAASTTAAPPTEGGTPLPAVCGQGLGPGGCPVADSCHHPWSCSLGVCFLGLAVANGTPCDDGNGVTVNDTCAAGVCGGVDPCAGVACPLTQGQCRVNGSCSGGQCGYTTVPDGQPCNDGDGDTVGDACFAGLCVGINPCLDSFGRPVVCPPCGDTCTVAGTCIAARERGAWRGVCTDPLAPVGTGCFDGNVDTVNETCTAEGSCVGIDLCDDVTCPPIDSCHGSGSCTAGVCADGPLLPVGTPCDDGDIRTIDDVCSTGGECAGHDPCDNVTCPVELCHAPPTCFLGGCSRGRQLDNFVPCNDSDANTVDDLCIEGTCLGIDTCASVVCPADPPADLECRRSDGRCILGNCTWNLADAGTPCDDGDNVTTTDVCNDSGECAGTDLCAATGVLCPHRVCHATPDCFQGLCPALDAYEVLDDGTPCAMEPELIFELLYPANVSLHCLAGL